jgi:hypothetical protein
VRFALVVVLLTGCDLLFLEQEKCPEAFAEKRYLFIKNEMPWTAAEATCRAQAGGSRQSHLAVVGSMEEFETLKAMANGSDFFVGLTNRKDDTLFRWITPERTDPIPWAPAQPEGSPDQCGALYSDGIHDNDCAQANDFICECDGFDVDTDRF